MNPNSPAAWNDYWQRWPIPQWRRIDQEVWAEAVTSLPYNGRVIDFGCGVGRHTRALCNSGYLVWAVDHSQAALDLIGQALPTTPRWQVDLNDLPVETSAGPEPGAFDVALVVEVLEHLRQPAHALHRMGAFVRTGGTMIITSPNGCYLPDEEETHRHSWTLEQLREVCASLGLVAKAQVIENAYTDGKGHASLVVVRKGVMA